MVTFTIGGNVSEIEDFELHELSLRSRFSDNEFRVRCLRIVVIAKCSRLLPRATFDLEPRRNIDFLVDADLIPRILLNNQKMFGWLFRSLFLRVSGKSDS